MTPPAAAPVSGPGPKGSRRPHHKTRTGCSSCKKRKVKCDEKKPVCSSCLRHSMDCDYPIRAAIQNAPSETNRHVLESRNVDIIRTSTPTSNTFGGSQELYGDAMLNIEDLELFHNYSTSIALSISPRPFVGDFWRTEVPRMGFTWPFILHGMFALSSIHMARFKRENQEHYQQRSAFHWQTGLRLATSLLPQINEDNCHALYVFAVFSCLYSFAQGPRPGEFLLFSDNGTAEWLSLFRGIVRIAQVWRGYLESGPLAPLFGSEARELSRYRKSPPEKEPEEIRDLKALLMNAEFENPDLGTYLTTLEILSTAYAAVFDEEGTPRSAVNSIGMLALFRVSESETFAVGLKERQPIALAIFAYFVVLFKQVDYNWMTEGWVNHLMAEIHRSLTPATRRWISWPVQKLGWIPLD